MRKELFAKLTNIDFKEVAKRSKGDIIYILMNDTQRLEYIFERPFYTIFSDIFDFIFVVAFLIYIDPAILLITTPFICIFGIKTAKIQKQTSYNMQAADSKITVRIEQFLSGYETIKSFNAENLEQQRFAKLSDISYANRKAGVKSLSVFMPRGDLKHFWNLRRSFIRRISDQMASIARGYDSRVCRLLA